MTEVAVKVPRDKLIQGLATLPIKEMKDIIDILIQRELFRPPAAKKIYRAASKTIKSKKLSSMVAEEAVRRALAQR